MRFRLARSTVLLLMAVAVAGPVPAGAQEAPPDPRLDDVLARTVREGPAEPVDVWIVLDSQPAAEAAARLRPVVARRVEAALAPVREALLRVDGFLPPMAERRDLPVARQIAAENALLGGTERAVRRAAREESARLLADMRREILTEAWPTSARQQAPIAAHVEQLGGRVLRTTVLLNAVIVRIPAGALPRLLADHPEIARIAPSGRRVVSTDASVPTIGAGDWTGAGVDGTSQRVAVVDTGIDDDHPAFEDADGDSRVAAGTVELEAGKDESDFNDDETSEDDIQGHGTHVAGIVASSDSTYGGVAPDARLLDAKCFYRNTDGNGYGLDPDIVAATDWALTNGASVLNLSFSDSDTTDGSNVLTIFYDAVASVTGASVAVASGNSGPGTGSVGIPADGFNVVAVGAFDDRGTTSLSDDRLPGFSSRGPADDGRRKPELVAPGTSIRSASNRWEGSGSDFVVKSGTSMAAPHVAGALALLLDHESAWQPEALRALLVNSVRNASPAPSTPDDDWGAGALDLGAAYAERARVVTGSFTSTASDVRFYALTSVAVGDRATLAWNRDAAYAASGRAAGGGSARALVDLDLRTYDEASGAADVSSTGTLDPLEQVKATTARDDAVLKVERAGAFPSGQTSVDWAVASAASIVAVDPPGPAVSLAAAADARGGAPLSVTATLTNDGGLRAHAPTATLTLPAGWSFAAGSSATVVAASLAPEASTTATWSVVPPTSNGTAGLSVALRSVSYGESFDATPATASVQVDATAPTANAGADVQRFATGPSGATVTLDGRASSDDSGSAVTLEWDTDGDGAHDDATGAEPSVPFGLGAHTVSLLVTDHVGNTSTDSVRVTVLDNPPVAILDAAAASVGEGSALGFDGGASSDVEGNVTFDWDFGDGTAAAGPTVAHAFADQGRRTVVLTVTDVAGQTATDTQDVTVFNVPPTASAGPDREVGEGSVLVLRGSATDPGVNDTLTFSWDLGDGTTATTADVSHAYPQDGPRDVVLTVRDGDGGSATAAIRVDVRNVAPVPTGGADRTADEGAVVTFEGSATDAGVEDVVSLRWDFGDGTSADGGRVEHAYLRDGRHTARLVATDDGGGEAVDTVIVTVRNAAPSLVLPAEIRAGLGVRLVLALEPTDASPIDAASLVVTWRLTDELGETVAEGAGRTVAWDADRRVAGRLLVDVADDDVQVPFETAFAAVAPAPGQTVGPILDLVLDPNAEKKLLAHLLSAAARARPPASRGALRKARKSVARAAKALARAGHGDDLVAVGLAALVEDLALGRAPAAPAFLVQTAPGDTGELLAALAHTPDLPARAAKGLMRAVLALRAALRSGETPARVGALRKKALRVAGKLGDGSLADWFRASLVDAD